MLPFKLLLPLLILTMLIAQQRARASARHNHLNTLTSGISSAALQDRQSLESSPNWQPSLGHNNWIILQATAAKNHNYDPPQPSAAAAAPQYLQANTRAYTASHNDFQLQRLPVNYYAYNHSTGNYQPPAPMTATAAPSSSSASSSSSSSSSPGDNKAHVVPPYVLAIHNMRRTPEPLVSNGASNLRRDNNFVNEYNNNNWDNAITAGKHDNVNMPQTRLVRQNADTNSNSETGVEGNSPANRQTLANEEEQLDEMLVPLENALDRVKHLCDVVKRIINDVDEDPTDTSNHDTATQSTLKAPTRFAVSGEVQGRHTGISETTTTTRLSNFVGTGRRKKFKKKLKKLVLPLLIAYKLKFLTLIPLLIGGLTLLVGTTGLAGFFFALFTAVMSLHKGGGSKSIVVKKI